MKDYYQFESRKLTGRNQTKHICPECGDKSFVLYVDKYEYEPLHETVGKCDRSNNCDFHKTPTEFLVENRIPFPWIPEEDWIGYDDITPRWLSDDDKQKGYTVEQKRQWIGIDSTPVQRTIKRVTPKPRPILKPLVIDSKYVEQSQGNAENNNFIQFLLSKFDYRDASNMCNRYFVGTANVLPGGVIFWQIDQVHRTRTGKMMKYNPATGHRIKEGKKEAWIHNYGEYRGYSGRGYEVKYCLFGLHLLNSDLDKPIGIVESEKTAIIASFLFPDNIWMATGSLVMLQDYMLKHLKGRKVILYPDKGTAHDTWKAKITEESIQELNLDISISDALESRDLPAGADIVDLLESKIKPKPKTDYERLKEINPLIEKLKDKFDCEIINK